MQRIADDGTDSFSGEVFFSKACRSPDLKSELQGYKKEKEMEMEMEMEMVDKPTEYRTEPSSSLEQWLAHCLRH